MNPIFKRLLGKLAIRKSKELKGSDIKQLRASTKTKVAQTAQNIKTVTSKPVRKEFVDSLKTGVINVGESLAGAVEKKSEKVGLRERFLNKLEGTGFGDAVGGLIDYNRKINSDVIEEYRKGLTTKKEEVGLNPISLEQAREANDPETTAKYVAQRVGLGAPSIGAGIATYGAGSFMIEGGAAYNEAKDGGATEDQARKASNIVGAINGALEFIPIGKFLKKSNSSKKGILKSILRVVKQSVEEGATEGVQEIASNVIHEHIWDEGRKAFTGFGDAVISGLLLGTGTSITAGGVQTVVKTVKQAQELYANMTPAERQAGFIKIPFGGDGSSLESDIHNAEVEIELLQDQIDANPMSELIKFTNKRTGELPEVTGKGKGLFRNKGDDIANEVTGVNDSEQVRGELLAEYRDQIERLKEKKAFLKQLKQDQKGLKKDQGSVKIADQETTPNSKTKKIIREQTGQIKDPEEKYLRDKLKAEARHTKAGVIVGKKQQTIKEKNKKETTPTISKRVSELKVLKTSIQSLNKGLIKGEKTGSKLKTKEIKIVQKKFAELITESELSSADKSKFINRIINTNTVEKFGKIQDSVTERIGQLEVAETRRTLRKQLSKEFKTVGPLKGRSKPVGRRTAEIEAKLVQLEKTFNENKTSLSNKQMEVILERVSDLKAEANKKVKTRKAKSKADIKKKVDRAVQVVTGGETVPNRTINKKTARQWLLDNEVQGLAYYDILDLISGKDKDSKTGDSYLSRIGNIQNEKNARNQAVLDSVNEIREAAMDIYGVNETALASKFNTDMKVEEVGEFQQLATEDKTLKLSVSEARKLYMEFQDPSLAETFEKMGYDSKVKKAITNMLSKEDKAFAEWQLDFYRKMHPRVNEVYKEMFNIDLPFREFYSPIKRTGFKPEDITFDTFQQIAKFFTTTNNSMKARQQNSTLRLVEQSDVGSLTRYITTMEHFIAFAKKTKELKAIYTNPEFKKAVISNYSLGVYKELINNLDEITQNATKEGKINIEILDKMMSAMATGVLSFKPSIMLKQLVSFPAYAMSIPSVQFIKGVVNFAKGPVAKTKFLVKHSTLLKTRGPNIVKDIVNVHEQDGFDQIIRSKGKKFTNMSGLNIMIGDQGAIVLGGWAVYEYHYNKAKKAGASEASAIKKGIFEFEEVTNKTQQSSDLEYMGRFQKSGSFGRAFTAFQSAPMAYFRAYTEMIRGVRTGRMPMREAAKRFLILQIILPNLFTLVSNLFSGESWEERKDEHLLASILGPLNGMFVVGQGLASLTRKALGMRVFGSEMPLYRFFNEVLDLMQGGVSDMEIIEVIQEMSDVLETLPDSRVAAGGAAISAVTGVIEGGLDAVDGDLRQGIGKMLGYSDWSVGDRGSKKKSSGGSSGNSPFRGSNSQKSNSTGNSPFRQ